MLPGLFQARPTSRRSWGRLCLGSLGTPKYQPVEQEEVQASLLRLWPGLRWTDSELSAPTDRSHLYVNKCVCHNKAFRLSFCLLQLLDRTGKRAHQELYNLEKSDKEKFHTGMKKRVYRMGCCNETISYKTVIGNKK